MCPLPKSAEPYNQRAKPGDTKPAQPKGDAQPYLSVTWASYSISWMPVSPPTQRMGLRDFDKPVWVPTSSALSPGSHRMASASPFTSSTPSTLQHRVLFQDCLLGWKSLI